MCHELEKARTSFSLIPDVEDDRRKVDEVMTVLEMVVLLTEKKERLFKKVQHRIIPIRFKECFVGVLKTAAILWESHAM